MSSGGGTATANSTPWISSQPYLRDIMQQAQNTYYGQSGQGGGPGAGPGMGMGGDPYPGMTAANGAGVGGNGGITAGALLTGGLGSHLFGENNSSPLQDINRALSQGLTVTDSDWAKAGFGPGGSSLNGGAQGAGASPTGAPAAGGAPSNGYDRFLSPTTQDALSRITQRAQNGSPLLQTAQNTVQQFAGGGATQNPYLDAMFKRSADQVRDYTNSQFGRSGGAGSTVHQDLLERNIGGLANQFYGQAYDQGQNRQLAAAQLAPNLANQDFVGLQQLLGAGQLYDSAPWDALRNYSGAVTGIGALGGQRSETQPSQSMIPQLLGTAASLAPYFLL